MAFDATLQQWLNYLFFQSILSFFKSFFFKPFLFFFSDEIFDVPYVGCVVGGLVTQGIITEGMTLKLGPFEDGSFRPVIITSIKRNRAACRLVRATQSAALAIDVPVSEIRKGMVLVDTRTNEIVSTMLFKVCTKFTWNQFWWVSQIYWSWFFISAPFANFWEHIFARKLRKNEKNHLL